MTMKRKRVTILQVAKAAGVSPSAVSFAFNNPSQVSQETSERVLRIAREMGYSPNPIARAMTAKRTGVIGLLVPFSIAASLSNPFTTAFMEGVGAVCDAHSYSMLVVSPYKGSLEEATRRAPVDGYIVLGLNESHEEIGPLRQRQVPFVIVDGDAETVSSINIDDEGGAHAAASHLLRKGHRDILVLTFEEVSPSHLTDVFYGVGGRRLKGYLKAFQEHDQTLPPERLISTLTSVQGGMQAFRQVWQSGARPSAVLAMSDAKAIGALREAQHFGLRVPDDLEIIGFDDIPLAEQMTPALSTVRQPVFQKGQRAADLLIAALDDVHSSEQICLPTELVLRGTTRTAL